MFNRVCCGGDVSYDVTPEDWGHQLVSSYVQEAFTDDVLTIYHKEIYSKRELRER